MEYIVSSREMKSYDYNTMEHFGMPALVLMERAALAVCDYIRDHFPKGKRVLIAAGCGNNGGDGLAIGRILAGNGYLTDLVLFGDETKTSKETRTQMEICQNYNYDYKGKRPDGEYDILVDAIFGIGLNRPMEGNLQEAIGQLNRMKAFKIAVDIPSGVDADTGKIWGTAFRADVTVTFAFRKIGHLLYPGAEYCGEVLCRDIGISKDSFLGESPLIYSYRLDDIDRMPKRNPAGNKGSFGKILLAAGSINMSGAGILCGLSAYRSGAGLVRIVTPKGNREIIQKTLPEAIITTYEDKESAEAELVKAMDWASVIAVGPGIGTSPAAIAIVEMILTETQKPIVIDADALNICAQQPGLMERLEARRKNNIIMTPHLGEFARLTRMGIDAIKEDIIGAARRFVGKYPVTLVCKDVRTICCSRESKVYLNQSGNDGMASAGSGDVLTGIIAALAAQHMPLSEAASLGVYLHGRAGDLAAEKSSRYALMASDIIEELKHMSYPPLEEQAVYHGLGDENEGEGE